MTSVPEPVVVLYKSEQCKHCTALAKIWDSPPNRDEDSITATIKKVYPKTRFFVLTTKDNTGSFDENKAPKDLNRYGKWYPMILLVPGSLWDSAMGKLGPKNDVKLIEGVQIMNGAWTNSDASKIEYVQKYNIQKPAEFGRWIRDAMENDEFKRVQNETVMAVAPIVAPQLAPVAPVVPAARVFQPLMTGINKPGHTRIAVPMKQEEIGLDICSMRIISRPK